MDVLVINAQAERTEALREAWTTWTAGLARSAPGYLGATAGVGASGDFVSMLRLGPGRDARDPTQAGGWDSVAGCLSGVTVRRSTRTDVWNRGGADDAGFVQIREGVSSDPDRLRHLYVVEQPVRMGPHRPEVLGGMFAWHGDAGFTLSAYFTSEEAARGGEQLEEFAPFFADIDAVMGEVTYLDLSDPWLASP